MNRRELIYKASLATTAILMASYLAAAKDFLLNDNPDFIPLDAYKNDYQRLLIDTNSASKSTNITLGNQARILEKKRNDYYCNLMHEKFKNSPLRKMTPPVAYKQKEDAVDSHVNKGIIFYDSQHRFYDVQPYNKTDNLTEEHGYFVGPQEVYRDAQNNLRHYGTDIYYTASAFLMYTQLEEYFCYGQPSSNAVKTVCPYCSNLYIQQNFYYDGDSNAPRSESQFYANGFCSKNPYLNSFGQRTHFGIPSNIHLVPILPCKLKINSPCSTTHMVKNY